MLQRSVALNNVTTSAAPVSIAIARSVFTHAAVFASSSAGIAAAAAKSKSTSDASSKASLEPTPIASTGSKSSSQKTLLNFLNKETEARKELTKVEVAKMRLQTFPLEPSKAKTNLAGYVNKMHALQRETQLEIPVFYPGSVVAVEFFPTLNVGMRAHKFIGICINKRDKGVSSSFRLRNFMAGTAIEMAFQTYSPLIHSIKVIKLERATKAALYYMRDRAEGEYTFSTKNFLSTDVNSIQAAELAERERVKANKMKQSRNNALVLNAMLEASKAVAVNKGSLKARASAVVAASDAISMFMKSGKKVTVSATTDATKKMAEVAADHALRGVSPGDYTMLKKVKTTFNKARQTAEQKSAIETEKVAEKSKQMAKEKLRATIEQFKQGLQGEKEVAVKGGSSQANKKEIVSNDAKKGKEVNSKAK